MSLVTRKMKIKTTGRYHLASGWEGSEGRAVSGGEDWRTGNPRASWDSGREALQNSYTQLPHGPAILPVRV